MTRNEFINQLDRALYGIPYQDKQEIIADYLEHFRAGGADGKNEDEIAAALGNPKAIARAYKADVMVGQAQSTSSAGNILRAIIAVISLGFFNLVFILGPFLGMVGVLVGFWAAGVGIAFSGIAAFVYTFFNPWLFQGFPAIGVAAGIFVSVGLFALGALVCIGLYYLTIWFFKLMARYLDLNLRIIKGRGNRREE